MADGLGGARLKVAVALFGDRVSPRLDFAPGFLVAEVVDGKVVGREEVSAEYWPGGVRIGRLAEMGVEVLICGGVDRFSACQLERFGVRVFGWVSGLAEEALAAMLAGRLEERMMMGRGGGRRCGGGRRLRRGANRTRNSPRAWNG